MKKEFVNKVFDEQYKDKKKFPNKELILLHKELFNLTYEFDIEDWKKIRDKNYYDSLIGLDINEQKKFTLNKVKKFLQMVEDHQLDEDIPPTTKYFKK